MTSKEVREMIYEMALEQGQYPYHVNKTKTMMTTLSKGVCYTVAYLSDGRVGWSIAPSAWEIIKANARFNIFLVNAEEDEIFWIDEDNKQFIGLVDNKLKAKGRIRIDKNEVKGCLVPFEDIEIEFSKL